MSERECAAKGEGKGGERDVDAWGFMVCICERSAERELEEARSDGEGVLSCSTFIYDAEARSGKEHSERERGE